MVAELSVSLYPDSPPTMGLESNAKANIQLFFSSALVPTKVAQKYLRLTVGILLTACSKFEAKMTLFFKQHCSSDKKKTHKHGKLTDYKKIKQKLQKHTDVKKRKKSLYVHWQNYSTALLLFLDN